MSMRASVGQQEIERFLIELGRTGKPGRLYLCGGSALIHRGIQHRQTLDIDLQISPDPADLISDIERLKNKLNVNVEIASPGDFMPLPDGWEVRSQFIRRYGKLDAFYFDWYSIALSKILRASQRDSFDVQLLKRQGYIALEELDRLCQNVLDKLASPSYKRRYPNLSRERLQQRYQAFRLLLQGS
jgi:hypothetical protein